MIRPVALILIALCAFLWIQPARAGTIVNQDVYTFNTIPTNGSISGSPGQTIGWGYTISNDSPTRWLNVTGLDAGTFLHASAGAWIFDFPILGPMASVTVPYDGLLLLGLYELTWDLSAPPGFVNAGDFQILAEWWTGDPFGGGTFIENAPDAFQPYSAAVVPEPSVLVLLAAGLLVVVAMRRRSCC